MSNPVILEATPGSSYADVTREFEAPVAEVFHAHVDKELVARWNGPAGYGVQITEWEPRAGGGYRYVHTDPEGNEYAFRGVIHALREGELIIQTFEFEGAPDQVSLEIQRFEELPDGRSRIVNRSVFADPDALAMMIEYGMETGVREGYEKLDAILAKR